MLRLWWIVVYFKVKVDPYIMITVTSKSQLLWVKFKPFNQLKSFISIFPLEQSPETYKNEACESTISKQINFCVWALRKVLQNIQLPEKAPIHPPTRFKAISMQNLSKKIRMQESLKNTCYEAWGNQESCLCIMWNAHNHRSLIENTYELSYKKGTVSLRGNSFFFSIIYEIYNPVKELTNICIVIRSVERFSIVLVTWDATPTLYITELRSSSVIFVICHLQRQKVWDTTRWRIQVSL